VDGVLEDPAGEQTPPRADDDDPAEDRHARGERSSHGTTGPTRHDDGGDGGLPAGGAPGAVDEVTAALAGDIAAASRLMAACAQVCPASNCALRPRPTAGPARTSRQSAPAGSPRAAEPKANSDGQPRMRPGELTQIVIGFLRSHPEGTFTPTEIAREINRSSGAIGNALGNLVRSGEARQVTDKPRTYQAAARSTTRL
jgi:hypothetical protein